MNILPIFFLLLCSFHVVWNILVFIIKGQLSDDTYCNSTVDICRKCPLDSSCITYTDDNYLQQAACLCPPDKIHSGNLCTGLIKDSILCFNSAEICVFFFTKLMSVCLKKSVYTLFLRQPFSDHAETQLFIDIDIDKTWINKKKYPIRQLITSNSSLFLFNSNKGN